MSDRGGTRADIFWLQLIYLFILAGVASGYLAYHVRLYIPEMLGPLPIGVVWYGALGAVLISLTGVFQHSKDWDTDFKYWYWSRPLIGAAMAAIAVLTLQVGMLSIGPSSQPQQGTLFYIVAFVVAYREEIFRDLIKRVADVILTPAPSPAPPHPTKMTPSEEPMSGGTGITISGSGLAAVSKVGSQQGVGLCDPTGGVLMEEVNFIKLCNLLAGENLLGCQEPKPPWGTKWPDAEMLRGCIEAGRDALPHPYCEKFTDPLLRNLQSLVDSYQESSSRLEALTGAISQHHEEYPLAPHLRRFLALVSDFYDSFLGKAKRERANFKIREELPPLAAFTYSGKNGPLTYPIDDIQQTIHGSVGVVSLPAVYANHPILWAAVAHETGGHDVVHAVPGLLDELRGGLNDELATMSVLGLWPGQLATLWACWMDEAVADVYGVLNIGPTFGVGVTAYIAALRHLGDQHLPIPRVSMESLNADAHPPDILRIHLAVGAVGSLVDLENTKRQIYTHELERLAHLCASGDTVMISGYPLSDGNPITAVMPLPIMQESARRVGRYIATVNLRALGNHSIQDIETWNDADEEAAVRVGNALAARDPIGALGDDAQLFAGAIKRLLDSPSNYAHVEGALTAGLDQSFAEDCLWRNVGRDLFTGP